jgi:hypothetical protein
MLPARRDRASSVPTGGVVRAAASHESCVLGNMSCEAIHTHTSSCTEPVACPTFHAIAAGSLHRPAPKAGVPRRAQRLPPLRLPMQWARLCAAQHAYSVL